MSVIKKHCFSCITRLKSHHHLANHRTGLLSPELHGEFSVGTSCGCKTKLGHVTSPESNMAVRGANVSHCTDFVSFHIFSLLYLLRPKAVSKPMELDYQNT